MAAIEGVMEILQAGYKLQQHGQLDMAEARYREVLKRDPRNIHALNLMGMLMINLDRPEDAVDLIQLALEEQPADHQAHGNLGLALKDLGRFGEAVDHFRESLTLMPNNPAMLNNLGNALRENGDASEAIRCFENALRVDPSYAACWSNLAAAERDVEEYGKAMQALDRAMELDPKLSQVHYIRGTIFARLARYEHAVSCYEQSLALAPDQTEVMIAKSDLLRDMNKPEEASATLKQALELAPKNPFALHALGVLSEQMGDRVSAADYFKRSLAIAPAYTSAYYQLAQLKGRRSSDKELKDMEQLWGKEIPRPDDKMLLAFALFNVWDQRGEVETAWHYLAEGNRIKAEARPFDEEYSRRLTDGIIASARQMRETAPVQQSVAPGTRVIFVVGMPRSGTTLTEQLLASHSQIAGAGEVSYAFDCTRMASSLVKKSFPQCVAQLNEEQLAEIGDYYMRRHAESHASSVWIVDKTPLNFQYIGLLARALPEAMFIHCHREPMDNCFSIHRIPFDEKQTYAHSLQALGRYYRLYQKLMVEWRGTFPGRILDVQYEDTVADLEKQAMRILGFLGLEFEPSVLEYYKAGNLVRTPSASQVRQPIYRDSVKGWRRYEQHLKPLLDALRRGC